MTKFGFTQSEMDEWKDKPFLLPGDKETAVILLHGWSAMARQVRPLAKFINKQGFLVYAPLFKGHGTRPEDLLEVKKEDWVLDVNQAIEKIRQQKGIKNIVLAGVSMGGNAAILASIEKKVEGIILLGTPIHLKNHFGVWLGSIFVPFFKKFLKKNYPKGVSKKPTFVEETSYQYYPTISVRETLKITRAAAFSLTKVTAPILILQTSKDYIVAKYSPWVIYNSVSSKIKKMQWIKIQEEDHVFIQGESKDFFSLISNFVNQIESK